jgi:hypothetical protein
MGRCQQAHPANHVCYARDPSAHGRRRQGFGVPGARACGVWHQRHAVREQDAAVLEPTAGASSPPPLTRGLAW